MTGGHRTQYPRRGSFVKATCSVLCFHNALQLLIHILARTCQAIGKSRTPDLGSTGLVYCDLHVLPLTSVFSVSASSSAKVSPL